MSIQQAEIELQQELSDVMQKGDDLVIEKSSQLASTHKRSALKVHIDLMQDRIQEKSQEIQAGLMDSCSQTGCF